MLIKGRCPELNARLGPAPFSQIKLVNLQRRHRFSPGECSEFGLESSLQVFAHLFSQKANAVETPGEQELALLWNQPPGLRIKLRCRGS